MVDFSKILVANRGEIAVRVMRTARAMGYRTVAVYSEADANALHVTVADQAVPIGPPPAGESYLSIERILAAAEAAGADAVHPGYGFLAENADFADACAAAGLTFIGPPAAAIRLMGNKAAAKRRMAEAGLRSVPGYHGEDQSDQALVAAAAEIGFPLMVKAAAGGGGRGMRLVDTPDALADALAAARSEAMGAFGSDELILEKAIARPRHVEIQVFGDALGNVIHLGERDCSIQRRHQKVIEEAPSPAVDAGLREAMGAAGVAAARAIDYQGAGTVEFLLEESGEFYFLEMNTRLQVEHPVTEMVTGLDLVAWQLQVAAGAPLPLEQDGVRLTGHAIEARLYAEDPYRSFLPQADRALLWRPAVDAHVRVDHGLQSGQEITPHYDPMVAKVAAWGESRDDARRRLTAALARSVLLGPASNRRFLIEALDHPSFAAGGATTDFIADHFPETALTRPAPGRRMSALAAVLLYRGDGETGNGELGEWRSTGAAFAPLRLSCADAHRTVTVTAEGDRRYRVEFDGTESTVEILDQDGPDLRFVSDGLQESAVFAFAADGGLLLDLAGVTATFHDTLLTASRAAAGAGDGSVLAPMHGKVLAIHAAPGERVAKGQRLLVLEAMKMEHEIAAAVDGTVDEVAVAVGDRWRRRA